MEIGEKTAKSGNAPPPESPPGQDTGSDGDIEVQFVEIRGLYRPGYSDRNQRADRRRIRCGYQVGYASLDDRGRIFINHRPRRNARENWQRVRRKDQQYVHAIVRVLDPRGALPGAARIRWEIVDPDDPSDAGMRSDAARVVDPRGPAPSDNRGTVDYSGPGRFEQVSGYPSTAQGLRMLTDIVNGESQIKMHCTNVGGDNYRLRARLIDGPSSQPTAETGLMTMWKRIDVEYHQMRSVAAIQTEQVARAFELAFVQLDFTSPFAYDHNRALVSSGDFHPVARRFCSRQFRRRGSAGWFFLATANLESSQRGSDRQVYPPPPRTTGPATIVSSGQGDATREYVQINALLAPGDDASAVKLSENGQLLTFYAGRTLRNQPSAGMTSVEVRPLSYYPVIRPGNGSSGQIVQDRERYLPARDLGFGATVQCLIETGQAISAAGVSPLYDHRGESYFGGRTIVFMAYPRNAAEAVQTAVHELTHGFGLPHSCGRRSVRGTSRSCPMAILNYWLFGNGTDQLDRWSTGARSNVFCEQHLMALREMHLEDNDFLWSHWPS